MGPAAGKVSGQLPCFDMGYAAALANILLVIVAVLSVLYIMVLERQQI